VKDFVRFGYAVCWIEEGSNIATRGKKFVDLRNVSFMMNGSVTWHGVRFSAGGSKV
jgi:hypothetical protein